MARRTITHRSLHVSSILYFTQLLLTNYCNQLQELVEKKEANMLTTNITVVPRAS